MFCLVTALTNTHDRFYDTSQGRASAAYLQTDTEPMLRIVLVETTRTAQLVGHG